jgi:hypothetical protein
VIGKESLLEDSQYFRSFVRGHKKQKRAGKKKMNWKRGQCLGIEGRRKKGNFLGLPLTASQIRNIHYSII